MELPNIHFQDFPIEFKQIKKGDVSVKIESEIGTKNPNGFIVTKGVHNKSKSRFLNEDLQNEIKLDVKETLVINAPVGNGKSYAIIQTIKRFYESKDDDYLIIVAAPYVSLVEQYVNDIHNDTEIPTEQIYNYDNLRRNKIPYLNKKIQVVTANTLLGNPGEDSYKNSDRKRKYLNDLIADCEKRNRKVVFIFDEVHDTIQNFKEEYIFNLWKWKNVLHKNFIISATFTEASFVVIEYLAELTDKKISILEFPRLRVEENQSQLFLHYSSAHWFTNETPEIREIILNALKREKNIDVLSYSKSLARSIISDKSLGGKLKEKFGEINDCTSETVSNQRPKNEPAKNKFDNTKCNIGTNFKSGVSIRKENHAFIIILPSRHTQGNFKNNYGIFSSGITSIIQAIARQRTKGEIHIILPRPNEFNYDSLKSVMTDEQINIFTKNYNLVKHYEVLKDDKKTSYIPLKEQNLILKQFYEKELRENVKLGIELVEKVERTHLARLEFPPYKNFKLNESENYFASSYGFFGADLSGYVTYCAFTNQFVNCNLSEFTYKTNLFFKEDKIQKELWSFYDLYLGEDYFYSFIDLSNFSMVYRDIRNRIFGEFTLKYKKKESEKWETISPYKNPSFEKQLLRFVAHLFYGNTYHDLEDYKARLKDLDYTRSEYFLDGISCSKDLNLEELDYNEEQKERTLAFQNLDYFREKLIRKITSYSRGSENYNFLPVKPFNDFITTEEIPKFNQLITYFRINDIFIKNGVWEFLRKFPIQTQEKKKNSFYTVLLEDFFNIEERRPKIIFENNQQQVKPIQSTKGLPNSNKTINLITPAQYEFPEPYLDAVQKIADEEFGGNLQEYYQSIIDALS